MEIWTIAFLALSLVGVFKPERFSVSHHSCLSTWTEVKKTCRDFPAGTMDENLPASAGDMDSISGLGRFHMSRSNQAHVLQLLSQCSRAWQPQPWAHVLQRLKPTSLGPTNHNYWSQCVPAQSQQAATTEPHIPRASALQKEKPPQWETALQQESRLHSPELEKVFVQQQNPSTTKNK